MKGGEYYMSKDYYMPRSDTAFLAWLLNFMNKLSTYAPVFGLDAATITSVQNDYAYVAYALGAQESVKTYKQDLTAYKNVLLNGPGGGPMDAFPPVPALGAAPATVRRDVKRRISQLVAQLKANSAYTEGIGEDLGIVGDEDTTNIHNLKPVLKSRVEMGHPVIVWQKGVAESIDIYVDRKDGKGFVYLANDSHPDYTDTYPLPAGVDSAVWVYRAAYKIGDDQVGHVSDEISVTVSRQA